MLHSGFTQMKLWLDLVREGQYKAQIGLSQTEECYAATILQRHVRDVDLTGIILAEKYLESQSKARAQRQSILAQLADAGLLLAGLFPERAKRKHVPVSYFTDMSQICFFELSGLCEALSQYQTARDYHEIGMGVERLARVLHCMRRNSIFVH